MAKTAIIAARVPDGVGLAPKRSSIVVTPRTTWGLRGHLIDGVIFAPSASQIGQSDRIVITENLLYCAITMPRAYDVMREQLAQWVDETSVSEAGGEP